MLKKTSSKKNISKSENTSEKGCFYISIVITIDLIITILVVALLEWLMIAFTPFNSSQKVILGFIILFAVAKFNGKILEKYFQ